MSDIIVIGISPNNVVIGKLVKESDSSIIVESPIIVSYVMQPDGSIGQAVSLLDPAIGIDGRYEIKQYMFKVVDSNKLKVYEDLYNKVVTEIRAKQSGIVTASEKDIKHVEKQLQIIKK